MILSGSQAVEDDRREAAQHMGAPRDIGRHAAIDNGGKSDAGAAGPSAAAAAARVLWATGRRLSAPFRERRGGAPGAASVQQASRRSNWWFLLPIFLHAVGGIVAFFVLREDDVRKARNCLYLGLSLTALMFAPLIALAALSGPPGVVD